MKETGLTNDDIRTQIYFHLHSPVVAVLMWEFISLCSHRRRDDRGRDA